MEEAIFMEGQKLTFDEELSKVLSNYKEEDIAFFNNIVQEATAYIIEPEMMFNVIIKEDGSNG